MTSFLGLALPFPARNFWTELLLLIVMSCVDLMRIFFGTSNIFIFRNVTLYCTGMKGNLTRRIVPLLVSLVFLLPMFFGYLYLILWQTYV